MSFSQRNHPRDCTQYDQYCPSKSYQYSAAIVSLTTISPGQNITFQKKKENMKWKTSNSDRFSQDRDLRMEDLFKARLGEY